MNEVDLDAIIAALDSAGQGGRRHVDEVATAIRELAPHTEAAAIPQLVLETLHRGEQEGHWTASRTTTVRRGRTTLPRSVTLRGNKPPRDGLRLIGTPLRPELAGWASTTPLSSTQRELILAVNNWLRRTDGGQVPIVAVAERAYELLRDEKAFDTTPPRGGATLWRPGRLTFELLRCERIPTPLTWESVSPTTREPGAMVCVENHATFRTLLRLLRGSRSPRWAAVAWVQGRNTAPLESLTALPVTPTRLDYLGDLDPAGLQIAAAACATAHSQGIPAGPAASLWELLVAQPSRPGPKIDETQARHAAAWLPKSIRNRAITLLKEGRTIPQEALRYDLLVSVFPSDA